VNLHQEMCADACSSPAGCLHPPHQRHLHRTLARSRVEAARLPSPVGTVMHPAASTIRGVHHCLSRPFLVETCRSRSQPLQSYSCDCTIHSAVCCLQRTFALRDCAMPSRASFMRALAAASASDSIAHSASTASSSLCRNLTVALNTTWRRQQLAQVRLAYCQQQTCQC
jgi:hypothetical protein